MLDVERAVLKKVRNSEQLHTVLYDHCWIICACICVSMPVRACAHLRAYSEWSSPWLLPFSFFYRRQLWKQTVLWKRYMLCMCAFWRLQSKATAIHILQFSMTASLGVGSRVGLPVKEPEMTACCSTFGGLGMHKPPARLLTADSSLPLCWTC